MAKTKGKPNKYDKIIGSNLREMRSKHSLSQEDLGNIAGVTFQQIQKYENGMNRLSASRLFIISKALNIDITEFYSGLISEDDTTKNK